MHLSGTAKPHRTVHCGCGTVTFEHTAFDIRYTFTKFTE